MVKKRQRWTDAKAKKIYEILPRVFPGGECIFFNHGYARLRGQNRIPWLKAADRKYVYNILLLDQLIQGIDIRGKDVLEVGSGRGGNSSILARYFEPQKIVGLDYSRNVVRFCKRVHKVSNLKFIHGNAMSLPFEENSFDIVLNIESSHCYPDVLKFYREAYRVLRPGGIFCYTDFAPAAFLPGMKNKILRSGFKFQLQKDITANVARGLTLNLPVLKKQMIRAGGNTAMAKEIAEELFSIETTHLAEYHDRTFRYVIWQLQKPVR